MKNTNLEKEKEIFDKAKANPIKLGELYEYFVQDVYRFAYSLVNNKADAEDVVAQTFLKFIEIFKEFEWKGISIKYWLFTTARNYSYSRNRKNKGVEFDETTHSELDYEEISFVDEIMEKDLVDKVKNEILKLTRPEQEVINLRIWEGMSFVEISQFVDEKENTVKLRFYRAIEKIKKALESQGNKKLFALPFIFTSIRASGVSASYVISNSTRSYIKKTLIKEINKMIGNAGLGAFLSSKLGIATTALVVGATTVTGVVTYNVVTNNDKPENQTEVVTEPRGEVGPTINTTPLDQVKPTDVEPTAEVKPTEVKPTATPQSTTKEISAYLNYWYDRSKLYDINFVTPLDANLNQSDLEFTIEGNGYSIKVYLSPEGMPVQYVDYTLVQSNFNGIDLYRAKTDENTYLYVPNVSTDEVCANAMGVEFAAPCGGNGIAWQTANGNRFIATISVTASPDKVNVVDEIVKNMNVTSYQSFGF